MSLQFPNESVQLSDFELFEILQDLLNEYAEFGQNPENNANCAELKECALELIEKIRKS